MRIWSKIATLAAAGCLGALVAGTSANAAEITVAGGGGPLPDVLGTLMPMFEKASGHKVTISFKGGPAILADLKAGSNIDLIIINTETVDELDKNGGLAANGKKLLMISKV